MTPFKDNLCFNITDGNTVLAEVVIVRMPRRFNKKLPKKLSKKLPNKLPMALQLGNTVYLHRFWVRASHRNEGLGSLVFNMACSWAVDSNVHLVLWCHPFEPNGIPMHLLRKFYRTYGFKVLRGLPGHYYMENTSSYGVHEDFRAS